MRLQQKYAKISYKVCLEGLKQLLEQKEAIQTTNYLHIVYKIEGQTTVPMMGCFIPLITTSILVQIT